MSYVDLFLSKVVFPHEAETEFRRVNAIVMGNPKYAVQFREYAVKIVSGEIDGYKPVDDMLKVVSAETGIHVYPMNVVFYMNAVDLLIDKYKEKGLPEDLMWDSLQDFKYKNIECRSNSGYWGTFVPGWARKFYTAELFALGRFQYEIGGFRDEHYDRCGVKLNRHDKVLAVHIPSSGVSLTPEVRMDSYKRAYEFYKDEFENGIVPITSKTWLFCTKQEEFLLPTSNVLGFLRDFEILYEEEHDKFGDAWRLFGGSSQKPVEEWDEENSLQRSYKKYIMSGGKTSNGYGLMLFDGEKIINK